MEGLEWNQEEKQEEESARGEIEENREVVNLMADLPPNIIASNLWVSKFQEHEIVGKCQECVDGYSGGYWKYSQLLRFKNC
jgi:hypothetical protein